MNQGDLGHKVCMERAIELARIALSQGESPVGSLIVRDGKIIGEGIEAVKKENDISGHAEINAIRQACGRLGSLDLSGCVLYTTAEPCFMCTYAIRQTRVSRVVIGRASPNTGGLSSAHPILIDSQISCWGRPPEIVRGVLERECEELGK